MKNIFKSGLPHAKGDSVIQINGFGELLAEGCGEVKLYDQTQIVFKSKRTVVVEGTGLVMSNLESGAVAVNGRISAVKFEDRI